MSNYFESIVGMKAMRKKALKARREEKWGTRKENIRYPFKMDEMVKLGVIKQEQMNKFMTMLSSDDDEMNQLAATMLQNLAWKLHMAKTKI